jgi:hypothetical protein
MSDTELLMQEIKTLPSAYSPQEALRVAAEKSADPNRKPISYYRGYLKNSKTFAGNPVEFQREIRGQ